MKYTKMNPELFESFYEILEEAFPPIERRSKERQKNLLKQSFYTIWVAAQEKEKMAAIMAVWDLEDAIYIDHFAVKKDLRGQNIGFQFMKEYLKNSVKKVVLEVELPCNEISKKRIAFYERLGFVFNEYEYWQPPLQKGFEYFPLKIMSYPTGLSQEEFEHIKERIYNKVYFNKQVINW